MARSRSGGDEEAVGMVATCRDQEDRFGRPPHLHVGGATGSREGRRNEPGRGRVRLGRDDTGSAAHETQGLVQERAGRGLLPAPRLYRDNHG